VHAVEASLCGRSAVARVPLFAGHATHGRENAIAAELQQPLAAELHQIGVASAREIDAEGRNQFRLLRRRRIGSLASARHQDDALGEAGRGGNK
jgi:hypothetical protein